MADADSASDSDDVEQIRRSREVREIGPNWASSYHAVGTESDDSSEGREVTRLEMLRGQTPPTVNKLMLHMAVLHERLKDMELESEDDAEEVPGCLGTKEDRSYLASMVRRFARDDLADDGDGVEAAIRMHIQTVPMWKKWLFCIFTCGLWIFFRPHDDTGVLILTKKGRVITYGKSQQAHPNSVTGFLFKTLLIGFVLCFAVTLFSVGMRGSGVQFIYWLDVIDFRSACIGTSIVALLLLLLYLYSHRPRPDCGSSYRQHFAVTDLCAAIYAREDQGGCFARRKSGKMKLSFTKYFPDEVSLATGLPLSAPNANTVGPCTTLPSAMAGDSAALLQEKSHQAEEQIRHSGGSSAIGHRTATFLAVLGTLGALYEYLAMLNYSVHLTPVCLFKVKGCSWKVENTPYSGKSSRIEGTLLPSDPVAAKCDVDNQFCDYFWQRSDFCSVENRQYVKESLTLPCDALPTFFDSIRPQHLFEGGVALQDVNYVVQKDFSAISMPTPRHPFGGSIRVIEGLVVKRIGEPGSLVNSMLTKRREIDFTQVESECETGPSGSIDIELEEEPDVEPLYGEDCEELQQSCLAETWSPETNGWWPPNRWIDLRFERALCTYVAMPVWITNHGQRLWKEERGADMRGNGLACFGEPMKQQVVPSLSACQKLCEETYGCNYAFHGRSNSTAGQPDTCILYSECPQGIQEKEHEFFEIPCGEEVRNYEQRALRSVYGRPAEQLGSDQHHQLEACKQACLNMTGALALCNAFALMDPEGLPGKGKGCLVYGPKAGLTNLEGWQRIPVQAGKVIGLPGKTGKCFIRHKPLRPDRKIMGVPGSLWQLSGSLECSGCFSRGVSSYYLEFPSLVNLVTQIIGVLAFVEVVRRRREAVPTRVAFSGKPEIVMAIVRDPSNPTGFAEREAAYLQFLRSCWALRSIDRAHAKDVLEEPEDESEEDRALLNDQLTVESVECEDYDTYDLVDSSRNHCYVDRKLLGITDEKVTAVWNETQRHSFLGLGFGALLYLGAILLLDWLIPDVVRAYRSILYLLIPGLFLIHVYFKLRSELQCLCVSLDSGRVIQLSRTPPTGLGMVFPHFYGGTDVRLDTFMVGKAIYVQLDMPLKPVWVDWIRSGCSRPWRRGVVTVRGDHGLLQIRRTNGEATVPFKAMGQLIGRTKTRGLKVACLGTAEIFGISMKRDLLPEEEELIWEWKLHETGHFTDPFDYTSLLAITDSRLHIARARCPKPMSLRGLCIGPRTFGFRCMHFQEFMGHHAGLTITSLAHRSLESYATTRSRAPPFWPGFGPPIDGFGVVFMPKFSQMYLAALSVTQKPYGLARHASVEKPMRLRADARGFLQVTHSGQKAVPKGARVVAVIDPHGEEIAMDDERWSGAGEVELGSSVVLAAVDHQWNTTSDEPWVPQLRGILDHILNKEQSGGEKVIWDVLEEAVPEEHSCLARCGATLFGHDMMGLPSMHMEAEKVVESDSSS